MAAPENNQFWKLRSKHGRDYLFASPDALWEAACEYFQWCEDNPLMEVEQTKGIIKPVKDIETGEWITPSNTVELPKMRPFTMQGLCRYLGCNTEYFNQFEKSLSGKTDTVSQDFSRIITCVREVVYEQKFTGAAAGFLNPNIIARDLGLRDNVKNEIGFEKMTDEQLTTIIEELKKTITDGNE